MDLKSLYIDVYILLQLFLVCTSSTEVRDCRHCKPGYFASRICSEFHDTVCSPCSGGSYTAVYNVYSQCKPCSQCELGEYVSVECTKRTDTVCESCTHSPSKPGKHYFNACMLSDQTDPDSMSVEEGLHSEDLPNDVKLMEEGSGVSVILTDTKKDHAFKVLNDTEEVEEGSGEIDLTDEGRNFTHVILPDVVSNKTDVDVVIPTGNGTIAIGDGIELPGGEHKNDVHIPNEELLITTARTINIGSEHNLEDNRSIEEPLVHIDVTQSADFKPEVDQSYDNQHDQTRDTPLTGASQKQPTDDSSGISVGIVVTVGLLAALVFFILGFIANRIWTARRDRSFNVQEAERRNGSAGVECSKVEYKDPENPNPKSNIYDEMPKNGRGGSGSQANKHEHGPIYTKPLKRNCAQPKDAKSQGTAGSNKVNDGEWAGFTISRNSSSGSLILRTEGPTGRPPSEIKFMDDDVDEPSETEKLLAPRESHPESLGQPQGSNTSPKSSINGISDKHGPPSNGDMSDEKTPMIPLEK